MMIDNMLDAKQQFLTGLAPETARSYHWFLDQLEQYLTENGLDPAALDPSQIDRFLDAHPSWHEATRRMARCAFRAFFRFWKGPDHPAARLKLARLKPDPQRTLTAQDVIKILASLAGEPRDRAIFCLMLDTGLRNAEICRVELDRVNLAARSLWVIIKGGKWGKAVYSEITAGYLSEWLEERAEIVRRFPPGDSTLFVSLTTGRQLARCGLRELFQRIAKRTGIPVTPHALRRTFAALVTRAGAPTRIAMQAGRWNNLAVFERYTQSIDVEDVAPWLPVDRLADGSL